MLKIVLTEFPDEVFEGARERVHEHKNADDNEQVQNAKIDEIKNHDKSLFRLERVNDPTGILYNETQCCR